MFGSLGVLETDGFKNQCHICGRWIKGLGSHIRRIHDMTADDYRESFELRVTQSLLAEESSERLSAVMKAVVDREVLKKNLAKGRLAINIQVAAGGLKSHRRRLQSKLDPAYQAAQDKAWRNMRKGLEDAREAGTILKPVADHMNTPEIRAKSIRKRWYENPDIESSKKKISDALKKYWSANPVRPPRILTAETRRRMSEAAKRRGIKPETQAKIHQKNRERCAKLTLDERRAMFKRNGVEREP